MRLVQVLTHDFFLYVRQKQLVKLMQLLGSNVNDENINKEISDIGNVHKIIQDKLESRRSSLQTKLRKLATPSMKTLTPTEMKAVMKAKVEAARTHARRRERRKLVRF